MYVALVGGQPAAFTSAIYFPHPRAAMWRGHRTVCLPDFQGVGIGNALVELMAASFKAAGHRFTTTTSHPAMVGHRARSPHWRMLRGPSRVGRQGATATIGMRKTMSVRRLTCSFEWVGPAAAPEVALDVS